MGRDVNARMPVWASQDRIRRQWLYALCAVDAGYGVLTVFGRSDGAPQVLLRSVLPFVTPLWGGVLAGSSVLIWLGYSVTGAAGAAFAWLVLTGAALSTIHTGASLSASGWVLPAWAAWCHLLIIVQVITGLDADRERRQRRE